MQLYNSMTRRKENFEPRQAGRVGMYACGITAYDLSHIAMPVPRWCSMC